MMNTIAFGGDGEIAQDNLLDSVVDCPFNGTKVIPILFEALTMMVILPMTTLVADPDSIHFINQK